MFASTNTCGWAIDEAVLASKIASEEKSVFVRLRITTEVPE
jgi:hypothetical protein